MVSKSVLVEEEKPYSKADLVKIKKIVEQIKEDMKDPEYRKAAKRFFKYHTGKDLKI